MGVPSLHRAGREIGLGCYRGTTGRTVQGKPYFWAVFTQPGHRVESVKLSDCIVIPILVVFTPGDCVLPGVFGTEPSRHESGVTGLSARVKRAGWHPIF